MSFKDLNLKSSYNSAKNNLVDEFYIPVLIESVNYDRVTGFFNSSSLALAAVGLKNFINNGGKMRLLCGTQLSPEDLDSIINASDISKKISDNFLKDIDNVNDEIELNHLKLLAWMVDNDILEIKIGVVKNENGYIGGILHEKTGILLDKDENILVFSGSNNETEFGWSSHGLGNIEKFKVFSSWEDSKFMEDESENFEVTWKNFNPYLEVMDVPKAAKEGLIKLAPHNLDEVMKLNLNPKQDVLIEDTRKLRHYQEEAITNWQNNGNCGVFEMATGTGKTFTALNCISRCLEENHDLVTVIVCPYAHLVDQWYEDAKLFDIKTFKLYSSDNSNWKIDLSSLVSRLKRGYVKNALIFTTINGFSSDFFRDQIVKIHNKSLLVVDEMHHVVSGTFRLGLLDNYDYRLGLSATPHVYNNEEGTEYVLNYFKQIVFEFGIDDALTEVKENYETYLAPYDYFPKKIELNNDEFSEFLRLSEKIAYLISDDKTFENNEALQRLLIARKRILNNAEAKLDCLRKILRSYENLDHLIVFCSPQQKKKVLDILKEEGVSPRHQFTHEEGTRKKKEFDGMSEREFLVDRFDKGLYKALVAIKCLDEGVDVPSADKVIIMSSSNNPREYIQRRGRVLRRYEGKEKAEIYDMAIIQKDDNGKFVEGIVKYETIRLLDFINSANNSGDCVKLLKKWGVMR